MSNSAAAADGAWQTHEGALSGLRVLDLTRVLSGPFASMILADLGADVIKVEDDRTGDDTRGWGPPFQGDDAAYFHAVNRGKRSLALDLKSDAGRAAALQLADTADVVLENFRPGTAARLGLGYEQLAQRNPTIVYGSVSGFGHTGPLHERAGYDAIAQAMSGIMSVTGETDGDSVRFGVAGADLAAGMWVTIGVLAALRSREQTGHGQHVDIALLDAETSWLTYVAQNYFASGNTPRRHGSAHPNIVPYQAFRTADGEIMIAVGNDALWRRFAPAVGLADLADDPAYATNADRVQRRETLLPLIETALKERTATEWAQLLTEAGIPVGPIHSVPDALSQPQLAAREMVVDLPHSTLGSVRTLGTPLKLSGTPAALRHASPVHGEHTASILESLRSPSTRATGSEHES
ncbi:CaiB/BaiF CoA transferase family protein [Flexivirga oryzae]|uniref:Formyl-CoA transferase/CoA:oxalate CoA-transferase n=1 Tax=Flexivirga oryzae TaxID=1794944 RepID=A0A839N7C8_9MICO|nr:CoA transferase [Flexivirga oryzae]MBB2891546.1 formyl-CoA transferase/CoA:oxalate CoA-transferase [Flexivirga oryzae]